MIEFKYRAVDKLNHPSEGTLRAESATEVVRQLMAQGLLVSSVEPVAQVEPAPTPRRRLTGDDLSLFNEQLHAIVKSGLPLAPSLEVMARDVSSKRLRAVLDALRADIEAGCSLSEAVERQPGAFSPLYLSMVRAGEASGNLSEALEILSAQSERNIELRYRLQEAVAYPALVTVIALIIMSYSTARGTALSGLDGNFSESQLGLFPRMMLELSSAIGTHWIGASIGIVLVAFVAVFTLRAIRRSAAGRKILSAAGLSLPIYGPLLRETATARFARALGMLLRARVPVAESIRIAASASGNAVLEGKCLQAAADMEAGRSLSNVLEETFFFSATFSWAVRTGESRGDVERVIAELAESSEHAAMRRSRFIATTASPAFTIVAAVLVVLTMFAVYRPLIAVLFGG